MKTNKYFLIPILAFLVCSCQDDEQGGVQPTPGQDVKFGVTLEQNSSRTIYGPESDTGFPIYWVEGDEVIVSSPDCADGGGVGSAVYKVHVDSETQNYASSLEKTEEAGVRWGSNDTGDFYSVYPVSSSHTKLGSDYKTVTLTMPAQQDNNIVTEDGARIIRSDMRSCFMYAAEAGVKSGETVNLKYKPLSTALRFTLRGPQTGDPVTITYVRIYAPMGTNISGTYNVDLSTATDEELPTMKIVDGLGRNYVTMNAADASTGAYLTLAQGEEIEMNAFLLIADNTVMTDKWYIEIGTSSGKSYKKYLDTQAADDKRTLVPGKVHRLTEALPPLASDAWDASNWMANLQRNVYLSEISIPGSWNSVNDDCQHNGQKDNITILQEQYSMGVRAFHLDTRWISDRDYYIESNVKISGLGIADGGTTNNVMGYKCMDDGSATTFDTALKTITDQVKSDEYMVLICTFAQGSYNYGQGQWRQAISDACANNDNVFDGRKLTTNTVVNDVLGKVIVIVNTYTPGAISGSKCLFMDMGITLDDTFSSSDYFMKPLQYENITSSGIMMYGTHAQITSNGEDATPADRGYAPTLDEREVKLNNILNWSKGNYNNLINYQHNAWMYLGLGGYEYDETWGGLSHDENYDIVGQRLNGWIDDKITAMSTGGYYPVGIVLMNFVEDYQNVVYEVLQMNNKYRKAYDPDRSPVDGSYIDGSNGVHSVAPGYSSGMKDNQTDAIGWTRCR